MPAPLAQAGPALNPTTRGIYIGACPILSTGFLVSDVRDGIDGQKLTQDGPLLFFVAPSESIENVGKASKAKLAVVIILKHILIMFM